jgi:hypothetical protein
MKAPSRIAGCTVSVPAQQCPQGVGAPDIAVFRFIIFTNQGAGEFAVQLGGGEDVDYAFGLVAGLKITLDEHLQIPGDGSMFGGSDVLDAVPNVPVEAHRDACD